MLSSRWMRYLVLLGSFCAFLVGCKQSPERLPGRVIALEVSRVIWSSDGKMLFYSRGDKLYRYDVGTSRRRTYRIPPDLETFDISPDGRSIGFARSDLGRTVIETTNLETGKTEDVYSSQRDIGFLNWASQDEVLLWGDRTEEGFSAVYLLDLREKSVVKLRDKTFDVFCAWDGSGFTYLAPDRQYHYYDIRHKGNTPLTPQLPEAFEGAGRRATIRFVGLSQRQAFYAVYADPEPYVRMLDLATMDEKSLTLPCFANFMELSPDLTKYWYTGPEHQDTEPVKLFLVDIPESGIEKLRGS